MPEKQYAAPVAYERKLDRVMERLGVTDYDFNYDRHGGWVQFRYRGEMYRFDHSCAKAQTRGINLTYGSDAFAQIVLSLEDLARMVERGIYELSTWVAGMKFLPPPKEIPACMLALGFQQIPESVEDVRERYRGLVKTMHPDVGGTEEGFRAIKEAAEQAIAHLEEAKRS